MARIEELLSVQELINYTQQRQATPLMGDVLFPEKKIEGLEVKMIKGANNLPVAASIHGFDTETEIASREGAKSSIEELALIKRKIKISERELIVLNAPRNSAEEQQAIEQIFNDVDNLVDSVRTRIEMMRMEALTTGKLVVNENGYAATIDYGTPAAHKTTKTWKTGTPDILSDIYTMTDKIVADTGFTPTRALTSRTVLNAILADTKIRQAMFGANSSKLATVAELNQLLVAQGLPTIATYDAQYRTQNAKGAYASARYLGENMFVIMPDGKLGDTIYGLTAEEVELRGRGDVEIDSFGNIIVEQYATTDPVAKWIKAVTTALPSFPYADQVFMATIS
jgi:hypothetical protein